MALSLDTHGYMGSPELGTSGSTPMVNGHSNRKNSSSSRIYKTSQHRRKNSGVSTSFGALTSSPSSVTAFPTFDPTCELSTTYMTANPISEPMPLFGRHTGSDDPTVAPPSTFKQKIKPLVRHVPGRDKAHAPIDLNMSKAENEERGAYVSDMPRDSLARDSMASARNAMGGHTRTASAASHVSASSTHSGHRTATYVHPARQTPHSPTPPMPTSPPFLPPDRPSSSHSNIANIPNLPPPSQFRSAAAGGGILRSSTSTPNAAAGQYVPPAVTTCATTVLSTSLPATSRSSMDSSFRDRITAGLSSRHRSRTNSNAPVDPEEETRTIAALRADFNAREAAKDEKYRRREEKRDRRRSEAEERKARRRRGNSGATAESSYSGGSDMLPTPTTSTTRKGRSGSGRNTAGARSINDEKEGRRSVDQLESIRYDATTQRRRPTMVTADSEEFDEKQGTAIPKRGKKQGLGSAGKATQSAWMTFWFKVKTALMKMMARR